MSPPDGSTTLTLNDPQAEEDRMRAALGLTPQPAQPSRPAQPGFGPARDSAGPITLVMRRPVEAADGARARLIELTDALKAERGERAAAQQALADARHTIQQLQAKLAHTEMGAAEALEAERKARLAAEARILEVPLLTVANSAAEQDGPRRGRPRKVQPVLEGVAEPKRRGRPPGKRTLVEVPEQEPVQWWLPSYAAEAKRRRSKV